MTIKTARAIIMAVVFIPATVFSQQAQKSRAGRSAVPEERTSDPYVPSLKKIKGTTPAYKSYGRGSNNTAVFTIQVNTDGTNNLTHDAANEPGIVVNPANPAQVAIGWRQFDDVTNNFRQAGFNYSADGGQTWDIESIIDQGTFRSDPVLDYDLNGNFYYNSLTNIPDFFCKVFKSTNGGVTWDNGTDAKGGLNNLMTIDRTAGQGSGNIYSAWNVAFSTCMPGAFTRSTDGNASYDDCTVVGEDPYWATMAVGNSGEVYIGGAGNIADSLIVLMSHDAQNAASTPTWTYHGVFMDGYLNASLSINPVGLVGQANIDVDHSLGPGRDNVYMLASVTRLSVADDADVMFARSTDGGQTWSAPVRVNDDTDTTNLQWMAAMSVAPNGRIDAVWLDTRDNPVSHFSALYYSYSTDQGNTWSANEKLSDVFDPHVGYPNQNKMGDYFDMTSDSANAYLAWANTLNGEEDVYFTRITPPLPIGIDEYSPLSFSIYPNPAHGFINVKCSASTPLSGTELKIYDVAGRIVFEQAIRNNPDGSQHEIRTSFSPGIYFVKVGNYAVQKLIVE
jgi:hypothetical protein